MDESKLYEAIVRLEDKVDDVKEGNHAIEKAYIEQAGEFKVVTRVIGEISARLGALESDVNNLHGKVFDRRLKDAETVNRIETIETAQQEIKQKLEVLDEHDRIIQYERGLLAWLIRVAPAGVVGGIAALIAGVFNKG